MQSPSLYKSNDENRNNGTLKLHAARYKLDCHQLHIRKQIAETDQPGTRDRDSSLIITITAVGFLWELMKFIFASVRLFFSKCLHISALSFSSAAEKNWSRQEQKFQ